MDVLLFKIDEIYESLQMFLLKRTLLSLIIPANVTNLTIKISTVNAFIAISASRCGYHAEDDR